MIGGLQEAEKTEHIKHEPQYNAKATSAPIDRENNYGQAGETYRSFEDWEREELIKNLSAALSICDPRIQEAMIYHFTQADEDYGRRVKEGIQRKMKEMKEMEEMKKQEEQQSSPGANAAADKAEDVGRESKPY